MKTKIQIKSIFGKLLFEYENENNSIKKTLEKAIESDANLSYANLRGANLSDANLIDANLRGANLSDANLSDANLRGANLRGANLIDANLRGANLSYANLSDANLRGANLRGANLSYANLRGANLSDANLSYANLRGANLSDANLSYAKNLDINSLGFKQTRILPDEGDIIGWKKCQNSIIVKLLIPDGYKRSHATGRKCRAEKAKVLEIIGADKAFSQHDPKFKYEVGKELFIENFDENWVNECSNGIHFFITRVEAENY